jgi:hypothetical protein
MSDQGRKGVGEQLKEKATPQDQKVLSLFHLMGINYVVVHSASL